MPKVKRSIAILLGVLVCTVSGVGAGAAVGQGLGVFKPDGVSSALGSQAQPMPKPSYSTNVNGQSFGSALMATSPETEPDLIQVQADNGRTGYVLKKHLDDANGATAAKGFRSPEEAIRWQNTEGRANRHIPVFEADGKTVVGTFTIIGSAEQEAIIGQSPGAP
ncbi:hypothetical protein Arth_4398 (plasmid) [Arthrobacter sp. FB24]|uniref:hypothetical protein n=1 Tax=Arthrobacter sp. (strain FB24) TaxID=290399 RepID=UPI0000526B53|nr:hypothetical protein [Arthrobacter sp. FB24]ABK05569.1 hypothetical protein Arth_4398 [Arthrobacter sp. FB24]